MPCYDPRSDSGVIKSETIEELRHSGDMARMLCNAMQIIENNKLEKHITNEMHKWWMEHQRQEPILFIRR